jgi:hypothetical protein
MLPSAEYRCKAEEAERRAREVKDPRARQAFLDVAEGWRDLERKAKRREEGR